MTSPAGMDNIKNPDTIGPDRATAKTGPRRYFLPMLLLLTLLGLFSRQYLLHSQPVSVDDFSVGLTAINYVESGQLGPTMWNHSNLCGILVYGAMRLFGTGVVGLKGVSLMFGLFSIPLLGLVARRFMSESAALLASFLWTVEPLAIDFSRQAIGDIYLAFFPLLGIYFACRYRESRRQYWLLAAGVSFGCGLSTKWSVIFPLAVTLVLVARSIRKGREESGACRAISMVHCFAALVLLPLIIYLLTFIPWFGRGYDASEWPALQQAMYRETSQHTGYHPLEQDYRDHWAYEWFVRPITYEDVYANRDGNGQEGLDGSDGRMTVLLAVANPLVWLAVLPSLLFAAWQGIRKRDEGLCYLAGLFLCSYLPLALAQRPIWANTALSVLPFAFMAVAYSITAIAGNPVTRQRIIAAYVVAVALTTAPLYPLVIGKGFELPYLKDYLEQNYADKLQRMRDGGAFPSGGR
ncbi:MAG: glycosyl transferase family [Geobacteraceae bacterium]|nr:MAG: glycosyl transferase family [Geobacteraceae bacterium]